MSNEVFLPPAVENLIFNVQFRHVQKVDEGARKFLCKVAEENAVQILLDIEHTNSVVRNLSALIVDKVKRCLGYSSPLKPCGEKKTSGEEESLGSSPGNVAAGDSVSAVGDPVNGVSGEKSVSRMAEAPGYSDNLPDEVFLDILDVPGNLARVKCGLSEGLSDAALLAIDLDGAAAKGVQRGHQSVAGGGPCRSFGEPAVAQQMLLVPSQASNESVDSGPKPESDILCTPSSHPSEPSSSFQHKRLCESVDDDNSGIIRSVRTKLIEYYPIKSRPPHPNCNSLEPARRIWGGSELAEPRKLDFGPEPGSEFVDAKPERPKENVQPKGCVYRREGCAFQQPQLLAPDVARAYGELSFTKRFLLLDHYKELKNFPPVKELEALKSWTEAVVDNRLYHQVPHPDHIAMRDWSKHEGGNSHLVFTCNVSHSGKCEFSGPRFEHGGTPLQRAFGEENILWVKFDDTAITHNVILDRYRCLAKHGIICGLKKFVFYAFKDAESKKKQGVSKTITYGCKCVFIAVSSRASADTADKMKTFRSISEARNYVMHPTVPTLAKAISRCQLALSQTTQIPLEFDKIMVQTIPDIPCLDAKGEEVRDANGKLLIHTDGCGFISKNLAKLCQDVVIKGVKQPEKGDEKQEYPLMMQNRLFYNGSLCKGVLVVNNTLPDNIIQVRPSMVKVERDKELKTATFNSLELCNTSKKPHDAKLFQHLILLLMQGGIKEEILLKYVVTAVEKLKMNFTSNKEAFWVVKRNRDSHHSGELALKMIAIGLHPSQEPFLQKVIFEMVKSDLQRYSLGKVPVSQTTYLMGCADPSERLERNQVAILLGNGTRICRERVLVYKPPGLHPGDVHVFEATWIKELDAYVGTGTYGIIFSTKGARSVTDEMAGSDLDGDQYWVSWNPELVDNFQPSTPWEAPNVVEDKKPVSRPTDVEDFETQHFEKFLQARFNPSMIKGRAANTWLALTDCTMSANVDFHIQRQAKLHISTLVDLFYDALDAEKNGKVVHWPSQVQVNLFPHFLEKKDEADSNKIRSNRNDGSGKKITAKNFDEYTSTSVLGKIYDMVKKEHFDQKSNVDVDKRFEYDGWFEYYGHWRRRFADYKLRTKTALEALANGSSNEQDSRNTVYDKLLVEYKQEFLGKGKDKEQLRKEASAIYVVVYQSAIEHDSQALQFAWKIAGSELCKILAENTGDYLCMTTENLDLLFGR